MHTCLHSRTAWPFVSVCRSCSVPAWLPRATQYSRGPIQDFFTQFPDSAVNLSKTGACEGTLACSICHLIFEESMYDKLEPIVDEEVDMPDLAYGLTKTSRLGCQVSVEHWMDEMTVHVPQEINDQQGKQEAVSSK